MKKTFVLGGMVPTGSPFYGPESLPVILFSVLVVCGFLVAGIIKNKRLGPARRFRHELLQVRKIEELKNFDRAREEYKALLEKYGNRMEYAEFIRLCLRRLDVIRMMDSLSGKSTDPQGLNPREEKSGPQDPLMDKMTRDILPATDSALKPPPPAQDRRKYLRVPVELQVESVSIFHNDSICGKAKIRNIGAGGALLETALDLTEDDTLFINQIELSPGLHLRDVFGKVTHTHSHQGLNLVGLEFIYLDKEEQQIIQKYIEEELK